MVSSSSHLFSTDRHSNSSSLVYTNLIKWYKYGETLSRSPHQDVGLNTRWLVRHGVGTTIAGEIFQQDRWMNDSDEESNEPNKRAVDTQDLTQRNSDESQAEKTPDQKEE
ncbi:hypothetical protein PPTG_20715 [Phytophthora nicotianae INRA-310]|uniref:Uncharacterized protein n=1 Tax=Phytophthora nicotianae (strain INRA-310) TaxID=761204 RepID=W2RF35_PHYN3|nr:hypothetical protein PPTG_20715 [Phytophthora nicotianae INRA-310]ETN23836.1 hypothetical protein PPTG_20715 [Phytophthora nicotianae INRA-310]